MHDRIDLILIGLICGKAKGKFASNLENTLSVTGVATKMRQSRSGAAFLLGSWDDLAYIAHC